MLRYAKFAPNSPNVMNGQLPTEADRGTVSNLFITRKLSHSFTAFKYILQATLKTLLEALPNRRQATTQAATMRVLSAKAVDEIYLMETPSWMFREEKAKTTFMKFSKRLREIEKDMVERNKGLNVPYTVLLPSKMPAGISI